jgi:hypothetical protein
MEVRAPILVIAINASVPDGPPRGFVALNKTGKLHRPYIPWRSLEAGNHRKYSDFSWYSVNSPNSPFLQSRKKICEKIFEDPLIGGILR